MSSLHNMQTAFLLIRLTIFKNGSFLKWAQPNVRIHLFFNNLSIWVLIKHKVRYMQIENSSIYIPIVLPWWKYNTCYNVGANTIVFFKKDHLLRGYRSLTNGKNTLWVIEKQGPTLDFLRTTTSYSKTFRGIVAVTILRFSFNNNQKLETTTLSLTMF